MLDLKQNVKYIKGVGPNRAELLNHLGISTLEDLITYYPREYEDRSEAREIATLTEGEEALIEAVIVAKMSEFRMRKGLTLYKLLVRDETATCQLTWYNQPYLKNKFLIGEKYKFFGKVSNKFGKIDMQSPVFDIETKTKNTGKIIPIYPSTYNLSQNAIRTIIENGMKLVEENLPETLPEYILKENDLCDINYAINQIHFPKDFDEFNIARKRLVFEELLETQLALLNLKNQHLHEEKGIQFSKEVKISDVINSLPFKLTKAQLKVLEEIDNDMELDRPMNRLLQGDVGSRKNNSCNMQYI